MAKNITDAEIEEATQILQRFESSFGPSVYGYTHPLRKLLGIPFSPLYVPSGNEGESTNAPINTTDDVDATEDRVNIKSPLPESEG